MTKELTFNTVTKFKNMRIGMVFTSEGGGLCMRLPVIISNNGRKFNAIYFPVLDKNDTSDFLDKYYKMKDEGSTEKEIADGFKMSIPDFRKTRSIYLAQESIRKNVPHSKITDTTYKVMYSIFADDAEVTYLFTI